MLRSFLGGLLSLCIGVLGLCFGMPAMWNAAVEKAELEEWAKTAGFGFFLFVAVAVGIFMLYRFWQMQGFRLMQYQRGFVLFQAGQSHVIPLSELGEVREIAIIPRAHISAGPVSAGIPLSARYQFKLKCRDERTFSIDATLLKRASSISGALRTHADEFGYQLTTNRVRA